MVLTPADAVVWPTDLEEGAHNWDLAGLQIDPGQTESGAFPVIRTDGGGFWIAALHDVQMRGADSVRAWRAFRVQAVARPLVIRRIETQIAPFPVINGERITSIDQLPHNPDETFFSDGSGYYQPVIIAEAEVAAAQYAVEMQIRFQRGGPLLGGECFSVYHTDEGHRLHEIGSAVQDEDDPELWTITFLPPLRGAVEIGQFIDFDRPRCTMRLLHPGAMNLRKEVYPFGRQQAVFVEHFFYQ